MAKSRSMINLDVRIPKVKKGKKQVEEEPKVQAEPEIAPMPPAKVFLVQLEPAKTTMLEGLRNLGHTVATCKASNLQRRLAHCSPQATVIIIGYLDEGTPNGNQCVKSIEIRKPEFFSRVLRVSDQTDLRPRGDFYHRPVVSPVYPAIIEAIRSLMMQG